MRKAVSARCSTDVEPDYGANLPTQSAGPEQAAPSPNGKAEQPAGSNPRPPSQFPDGQSFN